MTTFTSVQKAVILRTAKNVDSYTTKAKRLKDQITQLGEELVEAQQMIELTEAPIQQMTGGYKTSDLVKKEVIETGAANPQGNPIKKTIWDFIYPETILPTEYVDSKEDLDDTNEAQNHIEPNENNNTQEFTANYI